MRSDFASVAKLLANPARSAMVGELMDGRAMTAGELARVASVAASTASQHLDGLVSGGLVVVSAQGRHRYFGIASDEVAEALEAFSRICPAMAVRSLRASSEAAALQAARTCYDHLAGALGVAVLDAMLARRWIGGPEDNLVVPPDGQAGLLELGVDVAVVELKRRRLARLCLDWTERRPHLAGALGAALTAALLERRWITKLDQHRAVALTEAGAAGLERVLGIVT